MKTPLFKPIFVASLGMMIILLGFAMYGLAQFPESTTQKAVVTTETAVISTTITATVSTTTWQVVNRTPFDPPTHPDCSPLFAPEGDQYLCYLLEDNQALWVASLSNGLEKRLLNELRLEFIWSADGKHVIYAEDSYPNSRQRREAEPVYIMNIETKEIQAIGDVTSKWNLQALPTGQVGVINRNDIKLIMLDHQQRPTDEITVPIWPSRNKRQIEPDRKSDGGVGFRSYFDIWYQFSPDGNYLLLARKFKSDVEIYLIDTQSQERILVTKGNHRGDRNLFSWASDSQHFIYLALDKEEWIPEIWMMEVADKKRQIVWESLDWGTYHNLTWEANDNLIFFEFLPHGVNSIPHLNHFIIDITNNSQKRPQQLLTGVSRVVVFDGGSRLYITTSELVNDKVVYDNSFGQLTRQ